MIVSNIVKGIRCCNCSDVFLWIDIPKEDRLSASVCICQNCQSQIRIRFPGVRLLWFALIGVLLLALSFWLYIQFGAVAIPGFFIVAFLTGHVAKRYVLSDGLLLTELVYA